jgi:tetratricopeptide (TPR) repeat protein
MKKFLSLISLILTSQLFGQNQLTITIKKVNNNVLKIYTYDNTNSKSGQGSGIILDKNGVCITNYHVLAGAANAEVITTNGTKYKIKYIVDFDKAKDLAKFQIELTSPFTNVNPIKQYPGTPEIGTDVFSIGYPNSFESNTTYTVSTGIVSGFRTEDNFKFIQTSAPITHGSSGGGLFDYTGQLVGITQGTFSSDIKDRHANLNKVVPVNLIGTLVKKQTISFQSFNKNIFNEEVLVQAIEAYNSEDFKTAILLFGKHLEEFPYDPFTWYRYGNSLLQWKGAPENTLPYAVEALEYSVELDSTNPYAWSKLSLGYLYNNQKDKATYAIERAYTIAPNLTSVLVIYGKLYSENKDYQSAISYLDAAIINLTVNHSKKETARIYLERAICNAWVNNDSKANFDYLTAIRLDPDHEEAYWWYINFLTTRKRFGEACTYSKQLKSLNPNFSYGSTTIDKMINYTCNK